MAQERNLGGPVHKSHKLLYSAIIVIVALVAIYLLFFSSGLTSVSGSKNLTIPKEQAVSFKLTGDASTYAIYLASSSPSSATFYVGKDPVLTNDVSLFTLDKGEIANVSASGSSSADMEVKFISGGNSSANVELIYIPKELGARVSSVVSVMNPSEIGLSSSANATTTTATTTVSTTKGTTTVASTTTIVTESGPQKALILANASEYGILMADYKQIYINGTNCNENLYDQTFVKETSMSPTGAYSYQNVSMQTPTNIYGNSALYSGAVYNVSYTVATPQGNLDSLDLQMNITSNTVANVKFKGAFLDQSYSSLNQEYQTLAGIGNACAAYIP